jgi:hypothetical protein
MDCMGKTLIGLDFIIRGGVFVKIIIIIKFNE